MVGDTQVINHDIILSASKEVDKLSALKEMNTFT